MTRPTLLLADDHALVAEGLTALLDSDYEIVGRVGDGWSAVAEAERLQPDIVVLDIGMPLLNGIEAARRIRASRADAKLVIVSQQSAKEYVQAAFRAGASAYVVKSSAGTDLRRALADVLNGLPSSPVPGDDAPLEPSSDSPLTSRQREVLQLVAEGKTCKEIAHVLNISVKTVEFHKARIMDELNIRSTAGLTCYALDHGILQREKVS